MGKVTRHNQFGDAAILLNVRNILAGDGTLNWNAHVPVSEWDGIRVDATGPRPRVTEVSLGNRQLSGTIPADLGRLGRLEWLHLGFNDLMGIIPPALGRLTNLKGLQLSFNRLTGTIPPALGGLS